MHRLHSRTKHNGSRSGDHRCEERGHPPSGSASSPSLGHVHCTPRTEQCRTRGTGRTTRFPCSFFPPSRFCGGFASKRRMRTCHSHDAAKVKTTVEALSGNIFDIDFCDCQDPCTIDRLWNLWLAVHLHRRHLCGCWLVGGSFFLLWRLQFVSNFFFSLPDRCSRVGRFFPTVGLSTSPNALRNTERSVRNSMDDLLFQIFFFFAVLVFCGFPSGFFSWCGSRGTRIISESLSSCSSFSFSRSSSRSVVFSVVSLVLFFFFV